MIFLNNIFLTSTSLIQNFDPKRSNKKPQLSAIVSQAFAETMDSIFVPEARFAEARFAEAEAPAETTTPQQGEEAASSRMDHGGFLSHRGTPESSSKF